ncbi:hypothetical protein BTUL_0070g00330 [Botrytis tulipae]|uniref:Uncharacterized protein n=1 Tax=Botrytis tulipae TaxID=87230 RepID=A0A4Z1ELS8_9HELO|nr:hypothetical protein BTUL_0070g00330 [Botrytis tulipae]
MDETSEPGGYLQCDEMDSASSSAHSPNEFTPKVDMELVIDRFQDMCKKSDLDFGSPTWQRYVINKV